MGDLLPQIRRFSVHAVVDPVMVGDLAPTAGAALWVKQFLKLIVAKHQHGIGIDHQPGLFAGHVPLLQFVMRRCPLSNNKKPSDHRPEGF